MTNIKLPLLVEKDEIKYVRVEKKKKPENCYYSQMTNQK